MNGSILLGFCSSTTVNSRDFIINKYGEVKRKELGESKYRIVRKVEGFGFGTGDVLRFRYSAMGRCIKLINETKRVDM